MAKVIITGVPPWDGEYPFDQNQLTNRELHEIKKIAGVRAGELPDALRSGDNDVWVALAVIVAARAGKAIPVDSLWDADSAAIDIDFTDEEDDAAGETGVAVPPTEPPPTDDSSERNDSDETPTGPSGKPDGDQPANTPPGTGDRGLEIVAA